MRQALGCLLMLLGFLLGGIGGGALGMLYDAAEVRRMEAQGEIADFLPVVPFLTFVLGAIVGTLVARLTSSRVLGGETMKSSPPSDLE